MIRVTLSLPPHVVDILDLLVEEQDQTRSEVVGQLLLDHHPVKLIEMPDLFDQDNSTQPVPVEPTVADIGYCTHPGIHKGSVWSCNVCRSVSFDEGRSWKRVTTGTRHI